MRLLAISALVLLLGVGALAVACQAPDGRSGTCQVNTMPCAGSYLAGLCAGPANVQCCVTGAPPASKLHGPDVSRYQGTVDWAAVKAGGASFVSCARAHVVIPSPPSLNPFSLLSCKLP